MHQALNEKLIEQCTNFVLQIYNPFPITSCSHEKKYQGFPAWECSGSRVGDPGNKPWCTCMSRLTAHILAMYTNKLSMNITHCNNVFIAQ